MTKAKEAPATNPAPGSPPPEAKVHVVLYVDKFDGRGSHPVCSHEEGDLDIRDDHTAHRSRLINEALRSGAPRPKFLAQREKLGIRLED